MEKVMYLMSDADIQRMVADVVIKLKAQEPQVEEKTEKLFTTNEACEFLRCSKPTLHRWKKDGIITHVRIGNNIRYKESDLNKLINK